MIQRVLERCARGARGLRLWCCAQTAPQLQESAQTWGFPVLHDSRAVAVPAARRIASVADAVGWSMAWERGTVASWDPSTEIQARLCLNRL